MELSTLRIDIARRLREERERVGYSASAFAREADISREGLRLNESGKRGVSGDLLARAARLGVDVQYVVTGVRSSNLWDEVYLAFEGWPVSPASDIEEA